MLRSGTNIIAIGKNYMDHVKEMGGSKALSEPIYFLKPFTSVIRSGEAIVIPPGIGEVHHELELALVIGSKLKNALPSETMAAISGFAISLDMTARDMQAAAKKAGFPWTRSKCYDTFTPIGDIIPMSSDIDLQNLELWLNVDGSERQRGNTSAMIHSIPDMLSFVSSCMTLNPGDVILTGTPSGVGPVFPGQTITIGISGITEASFPVISG